MMKTRLALLLAMAACGGKSGSLNLAIVVSPSEDPFSTAAQVRVTVNSTPQNVQTAPVMNGTFNLPFNQTPMSNTSATILVEALDSTGAQIAWGLTPTLSLDAATDMNLPMFAVWVARPGKVLGSITKLTQATQNFASTSVSNVGVLYAGGLDANNTPLAATQGYSSYVHQVAAQDALPTPRVAPGMMHTTDGKGVIFAGSSDPAGTLPVGTASVFDPFNNVWAALSGTGGAVSRPTTTILNSGAGLFTGGADAGQAPSPLATMITADTSPVMQVLPSMVVPRLGHCAAATHFPDGDGAIVFGGLATGQTGPVVERLVSQTFLAWDQGTTLTSRTGATCTTLSDGTVLVLGGTELGGSTVATGLHFVPGTTPTVTTITGALSAPRVGHRAIVTKTQLLVCGGADDTGALVPSCDVLDSTSGALLQTIPFQPRRDFAVDKLDSDVVVLAGGIGPSGPLDVIELYTPPM
jgi:hypothetical protein